MSRKDDWEKQEPLVYESIFALYWDFNATFVSTKVSLRPRLPLAQVWEATEHIQKRRVKCRGKWGLFNSSGFPKLTALPGKKALLRGQTIPDSIPLYPDTHSYCTSLQNISRTSRKTGYYVRGLCSHSCLMNTKYSNSSKNILRTKLIPNVETDQDCDMTRVYPKRHFGAGSSLSATLDMQITQKAQVWPAQRALNKQVWSNVEVKTIQTLQSKRINPYIWTETLKTLLFQYIFF